MTTSSRLVTAIVTLPIIGTVSRGDKGEVVQHGEKYRIHVYAAKPDWKERKSIRDMFFVGLLEGEGYTSAPTKRALDVSLPDGYELVAFSFDEYGVHKWDSLPIHIDLYASVNSMVITCKREFTNEDDDLAKYIKEHIKNAYRPGGSLYKSGMASGGFVSRSINEFPRCSDYVGYRREQASLKAAELTSIAAKTGQTVALARHLALLVPIIEHG